MDSKGQVASLAGLVVMALIFLLIVVAVFGQIFAVTTGILQPNANIFISTAFNGGVMGLVALMPLVLVGAGIIMIVIIGFRLSR